MSRTIADYVALSLISRISWDEEGDVFGRAFSYNDFSGDMAQLKLYAEQKSGLLLTDNLVSQAVRSLAKCGLLRITDDNYSGTFVKIKANLFPTFVERARLEIEKAREEDGELDILSRASDYPNASAFLLHELYEDYHELGDDWLKRALLGLREKISSSGTLPDDQATLDDNVNIPASDRIVSLSHNQVSDLELKTSEIIKAVSDQNEIDGQPNLRELILGQLKAGRELILAGSFRLYILQITLIETLQFLAKRYEKETIGALAGALITALLKNLGMDS